MKRWVFSLALFAAVRCLAQPPLNDYFTNRIHLVGNDVTFGGSFAGSNWGEDQCEPCTANGCEGSLWWSWSTAESSPVLIEKLGDYRPDYGGLSVFVGTNLCDLLYNRVCDINLARRGQFAVFFALAGVEYQILVSADPSTTVYYRLVSSNVPSFRVQPVSQTVSVGASTLFTALALGVKPICYHWYHNGVHILNATNCMVSFDNIEFADAGDYAVVVSNFTGVNTSFVARLEVKANDSSPTLTALRSAGGNQFRFSVTGEVGRRYRMELSSDLVSWGSPWPRGVIVNTNETTVFSVPIDEVSKFVRLSTYHAPNEVCINNLRRIRAAMLLCAEDNHLFDRDAIGQGFHNVDSYIDGTWPLCPLTPTGWAHSYTTTDPITTPTCYIVPWLHILEEP